MTKYNVSWEPEKVCVPTPVLTAIGTAFAYSTYIEMVMTVLFLALLMPTGYIVMIKKSTFEEVVTGEISNEMLLSRITELENTVVNATKAAEQVRCSETNQTSVQFLKQLQQQIL